MDIKEFRQQYPDYGDVPDNDLADMLHSKFYADVPKQEFYSAFGVEGAGDFMRGAGEAFQQVPQLGYGLLAGAGAVAEKVVGEGGIASGIKKAGVEGYQRWGDKVAEGSKESDSWSASYERAKEGDFSSLVDWFQHGLGYAAGQGVQILATGGVGALAAKGAGVGASKLAAGMVAKEAAKIQATKQGAVLGAEELTKLATINVSHKIGQNTALAATAFGMEGGEIYGDLVTEASKTGRQLTGADLGRAFVATAGAGGLEFVGDKIGLDLMLGKRVLGIGGVGGKVARATSAGAGGLLTEGVTEFGQTLVEQYGKWKDPFSPESLREAIDSAALGALGGAAMGGAGGLLTNAPDTSGIKRDIGDIAGMRSVEDEINGITPAPIVPAEAVPASDVLGTPEGDALSAPEILDDAAVGTGEQNGGDIRATDGNTQPDSGAVGEAGNVVQVAPVAGGTVPSVGSGLDSVVSGVASAGAPQAGAAAPGNVQGTGVPAADAVVGKSSIDEAAHAAATSPMNDLPEPTDAQKAAGNYRKGHTTIHGLNVAIENPKGSERSGIDTDGESWSVTMPAHYGYFKRTKGADGDHVDTYIGDAPDSSAVYVVDQVDAKTGKFDEHKVLTGFKTREHALDTYRNGFSDGKGDQRVGGVTELSPDGLKDWLENGNTTKPLATSPQTDAIRPMVEQLIRLRKVAVQFRLAPQLDIAINKAKAAMKSGTGKAADFAKAAKPFKGKADEIHSLLLSVANALEPAKPSTKKPQKKSSDLLARIKQLGGIDGTQALDITGEPRGVGGWKFAFRKGGQGIDDLATQLAAEGFQIDTNDVDGGVQQLRDMIRQHINGERNFKASTIEAAAEEAAAEEAAQSRDRDAMMQHAEGLGINVKGMNERAILDAIIMEEDSRMMAQLDEQERLSEEAAQAIEELADLADDGVEIPFGDEIQTDDAALAAFLGEDNGQTSGENTEDRAGIKPKEGAESGARSGREPQASQGEVLQSYTADEVNQREQERRAQLEADVRATAEQAKLDRQASEEKTMRSNVTSGAAADAFQMTATEPVSKEEQKRADRKKAEAELNGQPDIFSQPAKTVAESSPADISNIIAIEDIPKALKIPNPATGKGQYNARKAMLAANQRVERLEALKGCLG